MDGEVKRRYLEGMYEAGDGRPQAPPQLATVIRRRAVLDEADRSRGVHREM